MCFGNRLGFDFAATFDDAALFEPMYGAFLLEAPEPIEGLACIGAVSPAYTIRYGFDLLSLDDIQEELGERLQPVFPYLKPTAQRARIQRRAGRAAARKPVIHRAPARAESRYSPAQLRV